MVAMFFKQNLQPTYEFFQSNISKDLVTTYLRGTMQLKLVSKLDLCYSS
jgi:hypothetical protein